MSEKFITPKTNIREAINNAAGPVALSNRVLIQFAPLSFLLVLISNPARLSGSFFQWSLVGIVGIISTVSVLLVFRSTVLPSTPSRASKRLLSSIAYLVAGLVRGVCVYLTGAALGLMPPGEFVYRLIGGPLYVYGAISLLAIFNASRIRHEKTLAELEIEKANLDELRGGIRERIRLQREDLLRRVQTVLAPVVDEIRNQLESSPRELANRLRDVVETVVRPLSHDIGKGSEIDNEVQIISKRAALVTSRSRFPSRLSAGAMMVPELTAFATSSVSITANIINFPHAVIEGSIVSLLVIYASYKLFQKLFAKLWVNFFLALFISIATAIGVALITVYLIDFLGFHFTPVLIQQFCLSQVVLTLITFYMQFLRTQRRDSEQEMIRVISNLAILNSQLRQEVWLNRRRIASILHGSVQAALYASAIRLAKFNSPTQAEIDSVQQDISAAISKLESGDGGESFEEVLGQIHDVWQGAVALEVPVVSSSLIAQLNANKVAAACAAEVVREAVSNAVKHGRAENIKISIQQSQPQLLSITVTNDGQPLPLEVKAGYGSTILDEVAFSWQLESQAGLTVLGATIAV